MTTILSDVMVDVGKIESDVVDEINWISSTVERGDWIVARIVERVDTEASGIRIAAQIPFIVARLVPVDFCKAQWPVRSFQAIAIHKAFLAHASAQAEKVELVKIG